VIEGPHVFALASVAAGVSREIVALAAGPEAASVAEPEVAFVAAEFSDEVVVFAVEPEVASVAVESVPCVAEPRVSVGIAVAFAVSVPVSVVVVEVDSPGRPRFFVFPSIDYCANSASSD
jgi:hypothetical protein